MRTFMIKQRSGGRWPTRAKIDIKTFNRVQWISRGRKGSNVIDFNPPGYVGKPTRNGNVTTADLLQEGLVTNQTIFYIISSVDDGDTPAQMDLDVGGFPGGEDGKPGSIGAWIKSIIRSIVTFLRTLFK